MDNILRWNWPNFLTVGLMSMIFAAALGFAGSWFIGQNSSGNGS